jgi:hypothetical protein
VQDDPALTPPPLIHLMSIHALTLLIQLLSSKQPAYCPSWERKKNASRERFWYDVRLKMAENATERTPRRTTDKTSVERTAKRSADFVGIYVMPDETPRPSEVNE